MYGILSHATTDPVSGSYIHFLVDGVQLGTFSYTPTGRNYTYSYNQLLWSYDGLPDASHAFELRNGQLGEGISLVLFDYLIYTRCVCSLELIILY